MLTPEAAEQAPRVGAGYQNEAEQAEVELNLAADPVLQEIYGSDRRRIHVTRVELVGCLWPRRAGCFVRVTFPSLAHRFRQQLKQRGDSDQEQEKYVIKAKGKHG